MSSLPLESGSTLGMMGGGQLGRMFVHAATRMGFEVAVLEPDAASPAGRIAHQHIQTAYTETAGLAQLANLSAAISTEFENVPAAALRTLAATRPVHPSAAAVEICQDRAKEKNHFAQSGVPCAPHLVLKNAEDCANASADLFPAILKTAQLGYDGKGQIKLKQLCELLAAWQSLGSVVCVLEKMLPLAHEISVIVARNSQCAVVHLPVQENVHINGILHSTIVPAQLPEALQTLAVEAAKKIAESLNYIGVLCVEFFVLDDGSLVANEMAPRPHNSGHYSIEACSVSQYELQVRTLANLPLVQPTLLKPCVMINLLGDVWFDDKGEKREPNWAGVLEISGAYLHLYGKQTPKLARKMGHITVLADTLQAAQDKALVCCEALSIKS